MNNGVAETLTGWGQAKILKRPLAGAFHIVNQRICEPAEDLALRAVRESAITGPSYHAAPVAWDGIERPIEDSAAPMRAEGGSTLGPVLVST